jgi:hypothetical protein
MVETDEARGNRSSLLVRCVYRDDARDPRLHSNGSTWSPTRRYIDRYVPDRERSRGPAGKFIGGGETGGESSRPKEQIDKRSRAHSTKENVPTSSSTSKSAGTNSALTKNSFPTSESIDLTIGELSDPFTCNLSDDGGSSCEIMFSGVIRSNHDADGKDNRAKLWKKHVSILHKDLPPGYFRAVNGRGKFTADISNESSTESNPTSGEPKTLSTGAGQLSSVHLGKSSMKRGNPCSAVESSEDNPTLKKRRTEQIQLSSPATSMEKEKQKASYDDLLCLMNSFGATSETPSRSNDVPTTSSITLDRDPAISPPPHSTPSESPTLALDPPHSESKLPVVTASTDPSPTLTSSTTSPEASVIDESPHVTSPTNSVPDVRSIHIPLEQMSPEDGLKAVEKLLDDLPNIREELRQKVAAEKERREREEQARREREEQERREREARQLEAEIMEKEKEIRRKAEELRELKDKWSRIGVRSYVSWRLGEI